jgi:hypothetical protein
MFYTKPDAYLFSCWYMLLFLSHTAFTASAVETLLAQLEPLLELVKILENIKCWWIKVVDLLLELLEFKVSRILRIHRKTVIVETTVILELGESQPCCLNFYMSMFLTAFSVDITRETIELEQIKWNVFFRVNRYNAQYIQ